MKQLELEEEENEGRLLPAYFTNGRKDNEKWFAIEKQKQEKKLKSLSEQKNFYEKKLSEQGKK
jgi:hypothetical protein